MLATRTKWARPALAFADIQPFFREGRKGAMAMNSGERWHCIHPACGCTVLVEANGEIEGQDPRCACGSNMKKGYSPPALRYLDFLKVREPALVHRNPAKD
jgi:hypothetical protein